jgi:putative methionine-R-sulfoxide reductase with GAF domain
MTEDKLYIYQVPEEINGACSTEKKAAKEPYDLAKILGRTPKVTAYLTKLYDLLNKAQKDVGCEWLGVYKKVTNLSGQPVLLKLAYYGEFSRAEFPLNEEFAKGSNNSTVGLTGKAILINSVAAHEGAYYQCDNKVNSEYCAPIFGENKKVIGIIDAEAFDENFFDQQKVARLNQFTEDLAVVL